MSCPCPLVDSGDTVSHTSPIYDGHALPHFFLQILHVPRGDERVIIVIVTIRAVRNIITVGAKRFHCTVVQRCGSHSGYVLRDMCRGSSLSESSSKNTSEKLSMPQPGGHVTAGGLSIEHVEELFTPHVGSMDQVASRRWPSYLLCCVPSRTMCWRSFFIEVLEGNHGLPELLTYTLVCC